MKLFLAVLKIYPRGLLNKRNKQHPRGTCFFNINIVLSFTEILSPFTYYEYEKLGCFKDSEGRAVPSLEGQDPLLDDDYSILKDKMLLGSVLSQPRSGNVKCMLLCPTGGAPVAQILQRVLPSLVMARLPAQTWVLTTKCIPWNITA